MASLAKLAGISVKEIKGIGPATAKELSKAGLVSVSDLLHHVPRRYMDRTTRSVIAEAPRGEEISLVGEVLDTSYRKARNLDIVNVIIGDETGHVTATWFNQKFRIDQLKPGMEVAVSGTIETYRGALQMKQPDIAIFGAPTEALDVMRVVPVHPVVGSISRNVMRRWIHSALQRSQPIEDPVPIEFLAAHGLATRDKAFEAVHFPKSIGDSDQARRRLIYDELFRIQLAFALTKAKRIAETRGITHQPSGVLTDQLLEGLPYDLTDAQQRVLDEIELDLRSAIPMHRLLQGEVGSGKTVVALAALLKVVEGGWQTAIMAPTEVLAEQHFFGVSRLLVEAGLSPDPFGHGALGMDSLFSSDGPAVNIALLTGSTASTNYDPAATRESLLDDMVLGQVDLVIGTHALIQEKVHFSRLGMAVVDEQHRFGVEQRREIKLKAPDAEPDLLIMTATPIPRTLSMTLYGDLEVSVIDEMPPGRKPVKTRMFSKSEENKVWDRVRAEASEGRQVYVVCPLVDDSDKIEAVSATTEYQRLSKIFPELTVGLIHGQMRAEDKDEVMAAFREGDTDVLVSTTVIEVGIDVPNATLMVIEDAERFGLSQLHQLRGRVGRGVHASECILIANPSTEESQERLGAMIASNDGFFLAEKDLAIRGYGTVFGHRQSGMKDLLFADIIRDFEVLKAAREDAFSLVKADPELNGHSALVEEIKAMLGEAVEWLFTS